MARSPFQGTFQPNIRPTVVTAPDAVVYINGQIDVIGCPRCQRSFNLNRYITSIQTDLSVDSSPGSASINLSIPRHSIDQFYFDGEALITPMMEVEIYAKGYYLVEGVPQYYPIFWGIVTEVTDNYSGGEHTVSTHCQDILKWWDICKMNINPAYTAPDGQLGKDYARGGVYAQVNPYDLIYSLALQSFGDIIVATGSMQQLVKESAQRPTFQNALSDMMAYWEKRFTRMRSNLVLYGTQGNSVRGDTLYQKYPRYHQSGQVVANKVASRAIGAGTHGGGQAIFDPASPNVVAYKQVMSNAGQVDLWQSEYQTKLELANAAKNAIGFEFYMDVTGDIVFKPPFYNLDVISNKPLSWIQDIDVIDWDFSESESEVVTQLILQGSFAGTVDIGVSAEISPFTSVTDYHLLRKYGWRSQSLNSEFLSDLQLMFYWGLDTLDRINSRRHRGTVTIPMRPELRLGFPIYIAPKDQIWYVSGISHSIQFGGRATTSLTLTAKRSKFIAPRGIGDLKLSSGPKGETEANKENIPRSFRYSSKQLSKSMFKLDASHTASLPPSADAFEAKAGTDNPYEPLILRHPKTGRIVGYPNVVMVYTRPFAPSDLDSVAKAAGQKTGPNPNVAKKNQEAQQAVLSEDNQQVFASLVANKTSTILDKYLTNRYQYGLNSAGVYVYARDSSAGGGVISEILLLPQKNLNVKPKDDAALAALRGKTALIRPVSDERGFEVIGHFQYGRRLFLKDGRLITNSATGTRATVDVQLALSGGKGGLQEMLTAQSQGLVTVTTGYQSPASTLSTLTPDDRQTAAALVPVTPDNREPKFVDVGDNFVSSPTLGSQEDKGSPSVEASQLSRALTLMEMSVKDSSTKSDEDCACITGRQELAWINSGYQVKTLSGTSTGDASILTSLEAGGGPINTNSSAVKQAESAVTLAATQLSQGQNQLAELQKEAFEDPENQAKQQAVLEQDWNNTILERNLAEAQKKFSGLQTQYSSPANSILTQTNAEVISKIDQFLVNLYAALDEPHQQFESAIRGDLLPISPRNASGLNADQINPPSEFAPPFNPGNRYMLGDPKATLGAIQTNAQGISKAWSNFGNDLRKNSERSKLSTQISQDQASIQRLTATRDQLLRQQGAPSTTVVIPGSSVSKIIESLNQQIAKLQQEVANNQARLSTNV